MIYDGNSSVSLTPTFASVAMYLRDPQWHRVPFILTSGKQRQFNVGQRSPNHSPCLPEIIFLTQDEQLLNPGILISEQLSSSRLTYPKMGSVSWAQESTTYPKVSGDSDYKYTRSYIHPSQAVETNAYVSVIRVVLGEKAGAVC